ncbi:hypothetical protein BAZMOX_00523_3 [methanotrophic endosymbiont of Bathymodiolus azoricus (Menez Gwen)]|jgi:hypothetical protein|nr:hypothetical protein BAZMOX_00523_3 [methanotrophic endosymbiont of Bathymodiolus azoricus (Menez Gwen)]
MIYEWRTIGVFESKENLFLTGMNKETDVFEYISTPNVTTVGKAYLLNQNR